MTKKIPDGPWSVGQGEFDDRPIIIRTNTGAASLAGGSRYRHRIGVAVPLCKPDKNGFPQADENAELDAIEDKLVLALSAKGAAVLVLVITTAGMREFVFYTSEPKSVGRILRELKKKVETHELQHVLEPDAEWEVYNMFAHWTSAA
jgi:Family of unknown function (DUF695)